jgi:glutathione S-transferase
VPELLGLPYSPWSEKARWALDARHVPYTYRTYAPLVGELALRVKLGRWSGVVSVPALTDDGGLAISDSANIARWADAHGDGPLLFPPGLEKEVDRFVDLSEQGLEAGRVLSLHRTLADREALVELVPRRVRKVVGPLAAPIGALGVRRTLRKYGNARGVAATHERELGEVLDALRDALAEARATVSSRGPSPENASAVKTLLGQFTFADIAMAQVLAFVSPPAFGLRVGAANRRSFTDAKLAERYADLLRWRDALYDEFRAT